MYHIIVDLFNDYDTNHCVLVSCVETVELRLLYLFFCIDVNNEQNACTMNCASKKKMPIAPCAL